MEPSDDVRALRTELAELRAELDELRTQTTERSASPERSHPDSVVPAGSMNRRQWMRAAAAAAVGGTAVALGQSDRVAAANGDELIIGNFTSGGIQSATSPTQINYTGSEDNAFVVVSGTGFNADSSSYDAAISGWTKRSVNPVGVYGFASSTAGSNGKGVLGRSDSSGTVGVEGRGPDGVRGFGGFGGAGVRATGGTAVHADGSTYGAEVQGDRAALLLAPTSTLPPPLRFGTNSAGEIEGNIASAGPGTNELWVCVESGSPGSWRRLAGPDTAGSLVPITPARAYDSRRPVPNRGVLVAGGNRIVSVADARSGETGEVISEDVVPDGARAIAYNITVVNTVNRGNLSVNPGTATESEASTINWSSTGLVLANGGIVGIAADRTVRVFCGGAGSTDFVIDITGYYL